MYNSKSFETGANAKTLQFMLLGGLYYISWVFRNKSWKEAWGKSTCGPRISLNEGGPLWLPTLFLGIDKGILQYYFRIFGIRFAGRITIFGHPDPIEYWSHARIEQGIETRLKLLGLHSAEIKELNERLKLGESPKATNMLTMDKV